MEVYLQVYTGSSEGDRRSGIREEEVDETRLSSEEVVMRCGAMRCTRRAEKRGTKKRRKEDEDEERAAFRISLFRFFGV